MLVQGNPRKLGRTHLDGSNCGSLLLLTRDIEYILAYTLVLHRPCSGNSFVCMGGQDVVPVLRTRSGVGQGSDGRELQGSNGDGKSSRLLRQ